MLLLMKRRKSSIPQIVFALGYVACVVLVRYQIRLGLAGIGALSVVTAVVVERRSGQIWKSYRRNYQPGKSKLMNRLNQPRPLYHVINIYVLWPAVFILGSVALYYAWRLP